MKLFLEHFIAHSQVLFSERNVDGHWVGETSSCSKCSMTGLGDGVKRTVPLRLLWETRDRKQRRTATPTSEARKIFLRNPRILLSFTLVTLYVSIFAEIPLTPASPSERNDRC